MAALLSSLTKLLSVFLFWLSLALPSHAQQEEVFRSPTYHFRLVYPPGWNHKTIKDPSVVTKGDKDGIYINVAVSKNPTAAKSAHDLAETDLRSLLADLTPPQQLIAFEKQYIDSAPAMMMLSRMTVRTLDLSVDLKSVQYFVIQNGYGITITGGATEKLFAAKLPEIRRIISTFKFEDHLVPQVDRK